MTDWTSREFRLRFDFLPSGMYNVILCKDGINADKYPSDYRIQRSLLQKNDTLPITMSPGGGFLLKLTRQQ
jgi:alpha-glucosidase